jgi:hypothetical protein
MVFESLNNARGNGYFDEGQQHHKATAAQIAVDMTDKDADLEKHEPETLEPYIQEWLKMVNQ